MSAHQFIQSVYHKINQQTTMFYSLCSNNKAKGKINKVLSLGSITNKIKICNTIARFKLENGKIISFIDNKFKIFITIEKISTTTWSHKLFCIQYSSIYTSTIHKDTSSTLHILLHNSAQSSSIWISLNTKLLAVSVKLI